MTDTTEQITLRDGDIYFWRWCDGDFSYHCKSMKAVVRNGLLIDTYWGTSPTDGTVLRLDKVTLEYKGNVTDLRKINTYEAEYYEPGDLIDMRHSNSMGEVVYVKPEAKRSQARILEHLRHKRERAESEIRMSQNSIERLDASIADVEAGKLDGYLP